MCEAEWLLLGAAFQLVYSLDAGLVEDIAANAVEGVGRIGDDTSVSEDFHHSANKARLRVLGIDLQDHRVTSISKLSAIVNSRKSLMEAQENNLV
jgi:hypothetical protein